MSIFAHIMDILIASVFPQKPNLYLQYVHNNHNFLILLSVFYGFPNRIDENNSIHEVRRIKYNNINNYLNAESRKNSLDNLKPCDNGTLPL